MFQQKHFICMMSFCWFAFGDLGNCIRYLIHITDQCSDNNGYLPVLKEDILLDKCNGTSKIHLEANNKMYISFV